MRIEVKPLREINLEDNFFDSFKASYVDFADWFSRKRDEKAFIVRNGNGIEAFLLLKIEEEDEDYSDIEPAFPKKRRLKVCSFKVALRGMGIGGSFVSITLGIAKAQKVDEIYVTIFDDDVYRRELIRFLAACGFKFHGYKNSQSGCEKVYVREVK